MEPFRLHAFKANRLLNLYILYGLIGIWLFFSLNNHVAYAQKRTVPQGLWVPFDGILGQKSLTHLELGGDQHLYVIGSGKVWRLPKVPDQLASMKSLGRYAPLITWDESVGINATGPFDSALLSEVERQVGESLEAALENQGDEDWISEDAALSLIEAFEEEVSPAIDSPYRVNAVYPQQQGIWIATGAGLWATTKDTLVPLPQSPHPSYSIIQLKEELWVSTTEQIIKSKEYLKYVFDLDKNPEITPKLFWEEQSPANTAQLFNLDSRGLAYINYELFEIYPTPSTEAEILPEGTYSLATSPSKQDSSSAKLWALTNEGLWFTTTTDTFSWTKCISISHPMTHIKTSTFGVLLVSPDTIVQVSLDCQQSFSFETPLGESVIFTDAIQWGQLLIASTSGGLFIWENEGQYTVTKAALKYLKRDLALFPKFFEVYQAALIEQNLDPRQGGYGMRPVLSAMLPQLTMRYDTRPSRVDQLPTFSVGSRQLTLLQPKPNYSIFLEWRVSLDFLSFLVDPERGSAYFEAQSQIEQLADDPLAATDLEENIGLMEDWTNDTITSQAQRLAMTTLALEKRQKHRDRAQMRTKVHRLYRERIKLTYQRWLKGSEDLDEQSELDQLRLQELDAHLDAMTGYRLQIQDKMNPAL